MNTNYLRRKISNLLENSGLVTLIVSRIRVVPIKSREVRAFAKGFSSATAIPEHCSIGYPRSSVQTPNCGSTKSRARAGVRARERSYWWPMPTMAAEDSEGKLKNGIETDVVR